MDILKKHFTYTNDPFRPKYISCFMAALRDARKFTNRDLDTGKIMYYPAIGDPGSWLGNIGYLVLLDQIGSCFKPKRKWWRRNKESIYRALKDFTALSDKKIYAIYALRCAFAHEFSLINIPKNRNPIKTHHFKVVQGSNEPLIKLPRQSWNGDIKNMTPENQTIINLEALGNMVEDIFNIIMDLADKGELVIRLQKGSNELQKRYGFTIY